MPSELNTVVLWLPELVDVGEVLEFEEPVFDDELLVDGSIWCDSS